MSCRLKCNHKRSMEYSTRYTAQDTEDKREKIQALSLAKECYLMKMALLTNATAVDDAIRFVSQKSKQNLKSFGEDEEEEADRPDYKEPRETSHTAITTNEVFQDES